ncbi:uncharacterized protein [Amphiura filiformis]|uniref:uncharacterized protein isoform X2 n=1 Tax=Amphiura filiformis TaxID=82378 RepID=UPI003B213FC5
MQFFKMRCTNMELCLVIFLFICTFCSASIEELQTSLTLVGDCSGLVADQGYKIIVEFTVSLEDGTVIIPADDTGEPFQFILGSPDVQESWNTELNGACLGETRSIEVPSSQISQGKRPSVPPDNDVIFEVNIIDIIAPSTTERTRTSQVKGSAITDDAVAPPGATSFSSKLLTTLVSGSKLTQSVTMLTGDGVNIGSNTKYPNKPADKLTTLNPDGKLTKQAAAEIRILNPDNNITPKVLKSPPVMSTHRKISTRAAVEGEGRGDTFNPPPSDAGPTQKVTVSTQKIDTADDTTDEFVTEYYMEEVTETISPEVEDIDDTKDSVSKGKPAKGKLGPKVRRKDNGFIYYHLQYIAIPVAIILLLLVVYCLYTVEFPDRKVKFYRVRDHDPVLDGPL